MTEEDLKRLFEEPYLAHLGTINPDGTPHVTPMWYERAPDGALLMSTVAGRRKVENLRRDPRVYVCIDKPTVPYQQVRLKGRAELIDDPEGQEIRRLAFRYLSPQQAEQALKSYLVGPRVTIRIVPERISTR